MPLLAYFDTNVFDHLYKKKDGISDVDERALRAAVSSRQITIVVGHINICETLSALRRSPDVVGPELSLIASLANWDYFVRFHSAILEDDIRHFAYNGERANTAFEDRRTVARIQYVIGRVIDNLLSTKELEAVIGEDWEQKRTFLDGVRKSRTDSAKELETFREANEIPNFEQYFEDGAEDFVLAFAQSYGVAEECERRGLNNLLKIPSVRAMVGSGMSFIYRTAVEKKSMKGSDSRDLQHAVCAAAAADVFVTHDDKLYRLLSRVPFKGLRVMRLHQLLESCARRATR
jgi:predicted nucleic acid-binding protein